MNTLEKNLTLASTIYFLDKAEEMRKMTVKEFLGVVSANFKEDVKVFEGKSEGVTPFEKISSLMKNNGFVFLALNSKLYFLDKSEELQIMTVENFLKETSENYEEDVKIFEGQVKDVTPLAKISNLMKNNGFEFLGDGESILDVLVHYQGVFNELHRAYCNDGDEGKKAELWRLTGIKRKLAPLADKEFNERRENGTLTDKQMGR